MSLPKTVGLRGATSLREETMRTKIQQQLGDPRR
jgi:hypothetical protein